MYDLQCFKKLNNCIAQYNQNSNSNRVAIYGLGENARLLIENSTGLNIICLVAFDHIGEEKYGLKIRSIEDAVKEADIILIAASFSVTPIIYSRIKDIVPDGMPILNMLGENLAETDPCKNNPYWDKDYSELLDVINRHDVISFDIFDTLIMRDVLEPKDIFSIVSMKNDISNFSNVRIESEKNCRALVDEPKLTDVYREMSKAFGFDDDIDRIRAEELTTEKKHLIPRCKMIDSLHYALSSGKKVFLTSDMYLDRDEILSILDECGIEGDYELIVSCEYGQSKFAGSLFDVLIDKAGTMSILHIGDDELVDKTRAEEKGIDSYLIYSSYRMLSSSCDAYLFDTVKTFDDKCYLGFYNSIVLNNPFALHNTNGKIGICSEKDIALLIYPMTKLFLDFIISNASEYDCLLFPSRDGFFLFEIYREYVELHSELNLPTARYIYSSRMSLSRATLHDEQSFDVLIHKLFGSQSKNVKKYVGDLFGVDLPDEFNYSYSELVTIYGKDTLLKKLHECVPFIVDELSDAALSYKQYLEIQGITKFSKYALIDIVSYGTQPYCLERILDKPVDMISIGTTGVPNVYLCSDRVRSIYGNVNEEVNGALVTKSDLSILHLFLEVLYSSDKGQFIGTSRSGAPVFLEGSEYDYDLLHGVQAELKKLFLAYQADDDFGYSFSPEFSHGMLRILRSKYSVLSDGLKNKFLFSDPYDGGFLTVNIADSL